jgi:hypothetical protein
MATVALAVEVAEAGGGAPWELVTDAEAGALPGGAVAAPSDGEAGPPLDVFVESSWG